MRRASWSLVFEPDLHVTVECFSLQGTWRVDAGLSFFPGGGFAAQFPELVAGLMVFVDELFELSSKGGTAAKIPELMPEWQNFIAELAKLLPKFRNSCPE